MSRAKGPRTPGHRQDGTPFKDGNTDEEGNYVIGKYRTPEHGKFRANDGRARGKRERGSKNVETLWRKQLGQKRTIDGQTKTNAEWLIEGLIRRGITRSDRAAETALDRAERLDRARERRASAPDDQIIEAYLAQRLAEMAGEIAGDDDGEADDVSTAPGPTGGDDADR